MKKSLLLISGMVMLHSLSAQLKGGVEQYNYFGNDKTLTIEPVLHIQTASEFHFELRYNYEETGAISFNAGKTFLIPGKFQTILTPMLGIIVGSMKGYSFLLNHESEWKSFYLSTRSQYCRSFSKEEPDFFYTWSEAGYNISPVVFTGLAVQCRRQEVNWEIEPGVMGGISLKNMSVSLYLFNPLRAESYVAIGLNYEFNLSKRK